MYIPGSSEDITLVNLCGGEFVQFRKDKASLVNKASMSLECKIRSRPFSL